jgi:hypothetical protein
MASSAPAGMAAKCTVWTVRFGCFGVYVDGGIEEEAPSGVAFRSGGFQRGVQR